MRILHTASTYCPSLDGVAEVVRNISERLAQRGHDVHVATTAVNSQSSCAELRGVHVHRFSVKGNLALGMRGEVEKYCEFVRSGDWGVLVNHCLQTWSTDAILDDLRSYPWASILFTHGLSGFDNPVFLDYYRRIPEYLTSYATWVSITNSGEEKLLARKDKVAPPQVITNGVDLSEWSRPTLNLRRKWGIGNAAWIVNVSNHNPLKGHRTVFRLPKHLSTTGARITLIGGTYPMAKWGLGDFGVRGGCFYMCSMRALVSGVIDLRTGILRSEVVSALQEADMVVSTSRWEANSVALLESMAAGTPWVSFGVGSARENAGGVVVRDLSEMANAITELLRDPDRRKSLGEAGRAQVVARHDWDRIADQYEQLYENVAGQRV
ncbi:MAG: glycosyltransferase family 4 protein [Candidatus Acidiferrales bacterium]